MVSFGGELHDERGSLALGGRTGLLFASDCLAAVRRLVRTEYRSSRLSRGTSRFATLSPGIVRTLLDWNARRVFVDLYARGRYLHALYVTLHGNRICTT